VGHILIIDPNPRIKIRKAALKAEDKRRRTANYTLAEDRRYNERSTVERVNGRIKNDFGARMVRIQSHTRVMTHLMFGIVVLTVKQLKRVIE